MIQLIVHVLSPSVKGFFKKIKSEEKTARWCWLKGVSSLKNTRMAFAGQGLDHPKRVIDSKN